MFLRLNSLSGHNKTREIDHKRERRSEDCSGLDQQVESPTARPSDPENRLLCAVFIGVNQHRGSTSEDFLGI